jgi:hypothetical protein
MFIIYSSDLIRFSHVHKIKYENEKHSPTTLAYTRIGLGDPNNNIFVFKHCRMSPEPKTCFHIFKDPIERMRRVDCYFGEVLLEEMEIHEYRLNESLISPKSNNLVLMNKTHNFMPNFVDNFVQIAKNDLD